MIYIIIGASCAGKSTLLRNSFLYFPQEQITYTKDLMGLTITPSSVIIGECSVGEDESDIRKLRRIGSDRIARTQIKDVPEQVRRIIRDYPGKDVVLEGVKIECKQIFDDLLRMGVACKLYLVDCDALVSCNRNDEIGSTVKMSTLKATRTRALNLYMRYGDRMDGCSIRTDCFTRSDFDNFNIEQFK